MKLLENTKAGNKPRRLFPGEFIAEKQDEGMFVVLPERSVWWWVKSTLFFLLNWRRRDDFEEMAEHPPGWEKRDYLRYFGLPGDWDFDPKAFGRILQKRFDAAYGRKDYLQTVIDEQRADTLVAFYLEEALPEWEARQKTRSPARKTQALQGRPATDGRVQGVKGRSSQDAGRMMTNEGDKPRRLPRK